MDSNYSLSDLAAVTNEGFGGGNMLTLIVIIVLFFTLGIGGNGYGRSDYGTFATAASQQEILFGQQFQNLDNKIDRIGNGIADATFALNNAVKDGNYAVTSAIVTEGRTMQGMLSQHSLDLANYNAGIQQAIHAEGEATRNMLQQNKIEALQSQVNQLNLKAELCGVVRYPNQWTYNAGTSPFCNCNGCGCGNV